MICLVAFYTLIKDILIIPCDDLIIRYRRLIMRYDFLIFLCVTYFISSLMLSTFIIHYFLWISVNLCLYGFLILFIFIVLFYFFNYFVLLLMLFIYSTNAFRFLLKNLLDFYPISFVFFWCFLGLLLTLIWVTFTMPFEFYFNNFLVF